MSDELHVAAIDGAGLPPVGPHRQAPERPPEGSRQGIRAYEAEETGRELSAEQIEQGTAGLAQMLNAVSADIEAMAGKKGARTVLRIVDRHSGDMVREIPQEALRKVLIRVSSMAGLTLDQDG